MTVISQLASSLNRRDETPNVELAQQIVAKNDVKAVKELVENLGANSKDIQHDCIKVLYEIGAKKPALISAFAPTFIDLLSSRNNRLQWGAMTALHSMATEIPDAIYKALPKLAAVAEAGSVITRDHYVGILITLCANKKYTDKAFPLLNEQLLGSPANQVPMYAENALPVIGEKQKALFIKSLTARLADFEKESKRKRVEKVIKKLQGR